MKNCITRSRVSGPEPASDGVATFEFRFSAADPVFAGHFPGRPLLPGVFQIEMTRMALEWALNDRFTLLEVRKAKFSRPILPEQIVKLELRWSEAEGAVQARAAFSVDGQTAGEALLRLCRSV